MELSFELPTKHLKDLAEHNDYNFTLAHLVSDEQYLTHYRECNKYTICDNSAFELAVPLSAPEVFKAASLLKSQEVVAPDAFGSGRNTIQATEDFLKYMEDAGHRGKFRVMGVVQGANVPDWVSCLMHMRDNPHIDVVGFSYVGCKHFSEDLGNARIAAVRMSVNEILGGLAKPIHLLGVGSNPIELKTHADVPTVRSCDTSLPIVQGFYNDRLHEVTGMTGTKLARPSNYFAATLNKQQLDDIRHNIAVMKGWAGSLTSVK